MPECPACHGAQTVKNGNAKNGTQTSLFKTCGRRFHPGAKPVARSDATRAQVLEAALTLAFHRYNASR